MGPKWTKMCPNLTRNWPKSTKNGKNWPFLAWAEIAQKAEIRQVCGCLRSSATTQGRITVNTRAGRPTVTRWNLPDCPILGPPWAKNGTKWPQHWPGIGKNRPKMAQKGHCWHEPKSSRKPKFGKFEGVRSTKECKSTSSQQKGPWPHTPPEHFETVWDCSGICVCVRARARACVCVCVSGGVWGHGPF